MPNAQYHSVLVFVHCVMCDNIFLSFQSIPADMQFCPNFNPPCYKSKDEVSVIRLLLILHFIATYYILPGPC
jgi:hypothetical protein